MATFVVDISGPAEPSLTGLGLAGAFGGGESYETIFVEAPSLIEAVERVLAAKPGADVMNVSKGRPGTSILG